MRAVVQLVSSAKVTVDQQVIGEIGKGLLVLLGVERDDTEKDAQYLVEKTIGLRIFNDDQGKMNRSLREVDGELMVVSQFTLLGDARKGRRPSFIQAAEPGEGNRLYELFVELAAGQGVRVQTGRFQTHMEVELVNDGPVTILLDSNKRF